MSVRLTQHAVERAGERLSWNAFTLQRMAEVAFMDGIQHTGTTGRLRRYFDALYLEHRTANNIRIYGHHVYLFAGRTLITVMHLPNEFKKLVARIGRVQTLSSPVTTPPRTCALPNNQGDTSNTRAPLSALGPDSILCAYPCDELLRGQWCGCQGEPAFTPAATAPTNADKPESATHPAGALSVAVNQTLKP